MSLISKLRAVSVSSLIFLASCSSVNSSDAEARKIIESATSPTSELSEHLERQYMKEAKRKQDREAIEEINRSYKERLQQLEATYNNH